MTTSPQHIKAQHKLTTLLEQYYHVTTIEAFTPTPNNKYVLGDDEEFEIKPYLLDVYAEMPKCQCIPFPKIGIEVDGKIRHKTTARQFIRDNQRTKDIRAIDPEIFIFRFNTKDLIGRGYMNPKTKRRSKTLSDTEILTELGINCTHI